MTNARAALAEGRPLSLRALAADMGMTAPALYRYVESLAELQARLAGQIVDDVQARLDAAVARFPEDRPGQRLLASLQALRAWALERPEEFRLVIDQLPRTWCVPRGAAPRAGGEISADVSSFDEAPGDLPHGPASATQEDEEWALRLFVHFMCLVAQLYEAGHVQTGAAQEVSTDAAQAVKDHVVAVVGRGVEGIPLEFWWSGLRDWLMVCAAVRMEVDGFVPRPSIDSGLFFRDALERWGHSAGVDEAKLAGALDEHYPRA